MPRSTSCAAKCAPLVRAMIYCRRGRQREFGREHGAAVIDTNIAARPRSCNTTDATARCGDRVLMRWHADTRGANGQPTASMGTKWSARDVELQPRERGGSTALLQRAPLPAQDPATREGFDAYEVVCDTSPVRRMQEPAPGLGVFAARPKLARKGDALTTRTTGRRPL